MRSYFNEISPAASFLYAEPSQYLQYLQLADAGFVSTTRVTKLTLLRSPSRACVPTP
jgi:hypothetical protein